MPRSAMRISMMIQAAGPLRREQFEGREHLIVPVVPIVAGILNEALVPEEEIAAFVDAWNGIPLPIGHPQHNGIPVSANTPRRVEGSVGRFWHAQMDADRLVGELWIDVMKCRGLGGDALEILRRLEAGEPLEVSTAFWSELEATPGTFRGRPFQAIHRHLRPDHLALLPHDIGACSWEDGCGAPRTQAQQGSGVRDHERKSMDEQSFLAALKGFIVHCLGKTGLVFHVLSEARRPRFSGTETTAWEAPSFEDYIAALVEGEDPPASVGAASAGIKRQIAALTLLGDPEADTFRDLGFFPVVNPATGRLNEAALRAVLGGRAAQADIPAAARESAQAMARRLLNTEFDAGLEEQMLRAHLTDVDIREAVHAALAREADAAATWLMVEAIEGTRVIYREGERLKARSFEITADGGIRLLDDVIEVTRDTRFHPVEMAPAALGRGDRPRPANTSTQHQKEDIRMKAHPRSETITALISTPGSGWTEPDRPLLEGMLEQALEKCYAVMVAHADERPEPTPPTLEGWLAQLPDEPRSLVNHALQAQKRQRQDLVEALTKQQGCAFSKPELESMPLETLQKLSQSLATASVNYGARGMPVSPDRPVDSAPPAAPKTMERVLEIQRQRGLIR